MYISGHYSRVNDPAEFKTRMELLAKDLPKLRAKYGVDAWIVTGKSGIVAMAVMAIFAPDEPFLSVRKPGEDSHGSTFEGNGPAREALSSGAASKRKVAIVDDFVGSGGTVNRVMGQLVAHCKFTVELAAVVAYSEWGDRKWRSIDIPSWEHDDGSRIDVPYVSTAAPLSGYTEYEH